MLITSRDTRRWIIPKGNPISGLRPHETAAREAFEEAGVSGAIERVAVGAFKLDEQERHRVRIAGKKLRYTAEFFADLYRGKKAVHRRERLLETIEDLQTALGHLNDLASGRSLFDELTITDADATLAAGKKADRKCFLDDAENGWRDLIEMKPFWR